MKNPADSLAGIFELLEAQSQTLKSEGGYGTNFSYIRPSGSYVEGIGGRTPGVLKFMELWDKSSEIITMGSEKVIGGRKKGEKKKIRKGAQMSVLDCSHPEIYDYIDAKLTEGRFTKFNLSVGIIDGFMEAVENDADWNLRFPDTSFEKYDAEWDGNIIAWESKGYPIVVHETVKARDLWEKIMKATYTRNDPGVLFSCLANKLNPISYAEYIRGTNPCFTGDMRFLTEKGYRTFESSVIDGSDEKIYSDDRISFVDGKHVIDTSKARTVTLRDTKSAFITREDAEVIELEFDSGQKIKCTPNHKFATTEGMVEAESLTPEHEILISLPQQPNTAKYTLEKTKENKDVICAFLMGLISGDGTFSESHVFVDVWGIDKIRISNQVIDLINWLYDNYFSEVSFSKKSKPLFVISDEKSDKVRIGSVFLKKLLQKEYEFNKYSKLVVPDFVLENARTNIGQAYISGLVYADGTISGNVDKGISIRLTSIDKEHLRQVQLIYSANGVSAKIFKRRDECIKNIKSKDYLCKELFELITVEGGWKSYYNVFDFGGHIEKEEKIYNFISQVKENYKKVSHAHLIGVAKLENQTVYCLTEPVTHSLIVSSIAVKNCGEINLPSPGVCLLFSLNLTKFTNKNHISNKFEFDFESFRKAVSIATRFADNINDITRTPLPEYKDTLIEKRRIGIGVLGLGSLLYMLGIKYGSKESLELIENISKIKCEEELLASAKLGKEKGSFPLFDREKFFTSYYWKTLPISPEVKKQVEEIGEMRNSHRSANAPTGNMSITVGCVSGGIEPVFLKEYIRWVTVIDSERAFLKEQGFDFPNPLTGEWFETDYLKLSKAGNDEILLGEFNGSKYQVDKSRGLTKAEVVMDYGWRFVKENYSAEEIAKMEAGGVFATTEQLTVNEHVDVLKIIAKYIDQNSSKTVNLPNNYPYEDFKNLYIDAWRNNIKGITTYRAGTMTAVLQSIESSDKNDSVKEEQIVNEVTKVSVERPKKLQSETHKVKIEASDEVKNAYVTVSINKELPYEVFINTPVGDNLKDIQILELSSRLSSLAMRYGVPVSEIVEQLRKVDGQFIYSIPNTLSKVLDEYVKKDEGMKYMVCPACGDHSYVKKDGCTLCLSCSYSACG
jgi:ribonucleoside-diphosphate reductase alpha chain